MRAVVIHDAGGPEVLTLEEVEQPQPAEREVLIRVKAASVNPVDWKRRRSMDAEELPAVLGIDVSGIVEESRAEEYQPGDEVFGAAASGSYAELATARVDQLARKPRGITHEQAASIPVAGRRRGKACSSTGASKVARRL